MSFVSCENEVKEKVSKVSGAWKFHVKDSEPCIVNFCYCSSQVFLKD